jgi:hypothetical protein
MRLEHIYATKYVKRHDSGTDGDRGNRRTGSGAVAVGDFIQFADPDALIGFPIVREATAERWLTGGDIDPESSHLDRRGDLWIGDEFGPWIVYEVDLDAAGGTTTKTLVVELAAIPDPDLVSLPPLHEGDIGLGNPFQVTCESIEALHVQSDDKLLLGCDSNFPNPGPNPALADDNEFIVVKAPGLGRHHSHIDG